MKYDDANARALYYQQQQGAKTLNPFNNRQ